MTWCPAWHRHYRRCRRRAITSPLPLQRQSHQGKSASHTPGSFRPGAVELVSRAVSQVGVRAGEVDGDHSASTVPTTAGCWSIRHETVARPDRRNRVVVFRRRRSHWGTQPARLWFCASRLPISRPSLPAAPPLKMRGSRRATNGNEPKRSLRRSAGCYGPITLNL
jgi:hypothetical protein